MPYYPDMSAAGVGLSGAAGATSIGITGPAQSQSIDGANVLQVVASGGAQIAESTTIRGFGQTLNFAGSAVASVAVASTTATITLNAGAAGTTITVAETGTKVGDVLALNFNGIPGDISIASSTATIDVSPSSSVSGGLVYISGSTLKTNPTGGVYYDEADNRLEITGSSATLAIYSMPYNAVTPSANGEPEGIFFVRSKAGRLLPNFVGPAGQDFPLQPMFGMNRIQMWTAIAGVTTTASWGIGIPGLTGTATAGALATTNFSSSLARLTYVTANAGANVAAGIRGVTAQYWLGNIAGGGGFYYVHRGIVASATSGTAGMRVFVGMHSGTANPPAFNPSVMLNIIGVGKDPGDTNYQVMHAGSAGAAVKLDTGISSTQGDVIEVRLYAKPNGNQQAGTIGASFELLSIGGSGANGGSYNWINSASTNLPAATQFLNWHAYMCVTGGLARYAPIGVYVETDS